MSALRPRALLRRAAGRLRPVATAAALIVAMLGVGAAVMVAGGQTAGAANSVPPVAGNVTPSNVQCPPTGCLGKPHELGIPQVDTGNAVIDAIDLLSLLAGVLSVIFLVLGGIRYITSEGDASRVQGAKQTLTYAIVGLAVSLIAPLIVAFVIVRGPH